MDAQEIPPDINSMASVNRLARKYAVIIPACNEEACLPQVLAELRAALDPEIFFVVVGVNASTDRTAAVALEAGALVAQTHLRGYGHGCQVAVSRAQEAAPPVDAYIFFAADGANDPQDIAALVARHEAGVPMVLGCRTRTASNRTVMNAHYVLANRAFGLICGLLTGRFFADLGPLRLIARPLFERLELREWTYGWTIEAQIRAALLGELIEEVPVRERRRVAGEQKVSHVSWRRTLSVAVQIVAAALRTRFAGLGRRAA